MYKVPTAIGLLFGAVFIMICLGIPVFLLWISGGFPVDFILFFMINR